jgi:hypothetical protein
MTALALIPLFISGDWTSPALSDRLSAKQAQASNPLAAQGSAHDWDLLNATVSRIFWPKSKLISLLLKHPHRTTDGKTAARRGCVETLVNSTRHGLGSEVPPANFSGCWLAFGIKRVKRPG